MLPPNCITIPRTELPMEQLLSIHKKERGAKASTVAKSDADEAAGTGEELSVVHAGTDMATDCGADAAGARDKESCKPIVLR
jgi:hypothetical protein